MIIQTSPDRQKAESLRKMAEVTLKRLNETKAKDYPSNTLNDYYDIIHKLMESLTALKGIKIKGEGSHIELIDHIAKEHQLDDNTKIFLQQVREFRNRIAYEGFMITEDYIERNKNKIEKVIESLSNNVKNELRS